METFLFSDIIFGPVRSRRLGSSLGINLLPVDAKVCNFDCIYCECGWSDFANPRLSGLPSATQVIEALRIRLTSMLANQSLPDTITYAGNGEPTLHPEFARIVDATIQLRNQLCPAVKVAVLSNATRIANPDIRQALTKTDLNILKIDSAIAATRRILNGTESVADNDTLLGNMKEMRANLYIQTMFLKGEFKGIPFDNTTETEVSAWLSLVDAIAPKGVMIYTIERATPADHMLKTEPSVLQSIADRVSQAGREVLISL